MIFSSPIFLFLFLPIVLFFYFLADRKFKNFILLIFSIAFYTWGEPKYVFVMLFSICMNYIMAIWIQA